MAQQLCNQSHYSVIIGSDSIRLPLLDRYNLQNAVAINYRRRNWKIGVLVQLARHSSAKACLLTELQCKLA